MAKSSKKKERRRYRRYRHFAYLLHELVCDDRDLCTYGEEYTTTPSPPAEERYHCQRAVLAENLAAELVK